MAVVRQWETENPLSGYDVTVAVHNYTVPLASGTVTEPGWTPSNSTLATVASRSDALQPLFLVNDGTANRPVGAAAHEFGHVMGLSHASASCGAGAGGGGEPWLPDQGGRLQGVEFDQTTGNPVTPVVDTSVQPQFDSMSYCGPGATPSNTTGSSVEGTLWISPRNWNHAFATLRAYAALPATPARSSSTDRAATASSGQAFVVGVANAGSARILRVVQPHGDEAIPAPAPDSPLRMRALDSAGRVLVDEGVQVQQLLDAPGAGTFVAPVPARADAVELTSHGAVLDRQQRNRHRKCGCWRRHATRGRTPAASWSSAGRRATRTATNSKPQSTTPSMVAEAGARCMTGPVPGVQASPDGSSKVAPEPESACT